MYRLLILLFLFVSCKKDNNMSCINEIELTYTDCDGEQTLTFCGTLTPIDTELIDEESGYSPDGKPSRISAVITDVWQLATMPMEYTEIRQLMDVINSGASVQIGSDTFNLKQGSIFKPTKYGKLMVGKVELIKDTTWMTLCKPCPKPEPDVNDFVFTIDKPGDFGMYSALTPDFKVFINGEKVTPSPNYQVFKGDEFWVRGARFTTPNDFTFVDEIKQWGATDWAGNRDNLRDFIRSMTPNVTVSENHIQPFTDFSNIFESRNFADPNIDLNWLDVSNVTTFFNAFANNNFNGFIEDWNLQSANSIYGMFFLNSAFNRDISGWNTSNIASMGATFMNATSFNQDLSGWDVGNVNLCQNFAWDTPIEGTSKMPNFTNCSP